MVELGTRIRRRPLAKILGDQWGLKALDPVKLQIDPAATTRLDAELATELRGLPVAFDEDGLVVAVAEPTADRFDALRNLLGDVSFVVVPTATLDELLDQRRATLERTRTPVELVGAWLGGLSESSRVGQGAEERGRDTDEAPLENEGSRVPHEAVGRDTDEAPLDDDNIEEKRGETIEEVYAIEERHDNGRPTFEPVVSAARGSGSVIDQLRVLAVPLEALEHQLAETRRRLAVQDTELAVLRRARASDLETINNLGAELEQRRRRMGALRTATRQLADELTN